MLEPTNSNYLAFDNEIDMMIADTNEDGKLNVRDVTRLQRALLESGNSNYLAFAWIK